MLVRKQTDGDEERPTSGGLANAPKVSRLVITAQFHDTHKGTTTSGSLPKSSLRDANYDYRAHGFAIPGEAKTGGNAHLEIVAKMNSYGEVYAANAKTGNPGIISGLSAAGHPAGAGNWGHGGQGGAGSHSGGGSAHSSGGGGSSSGGGSSHAAGGSGGGSAASSLSSAASAGGGHH